MPQSQPKATTPRFGDILPAHQAGTFAKVRSVWHGLRQGAAVPARADLAPVSLGPTLQICFLAERAPGQGARFRLVGRGLNDAYGMDLRAIPLPALVAAPLQRAFAASIDAVFDHAAILFAQYDRADAQTGLRSVMLHPMRDAQGGTTLALGVAAGFEDGAVLGDLMRQRHCAVMPMPTDLDDPFCTDCARRSDDPRGATVRGGPCVDRRATQKGVQSPARPSFTVIKGGK